MGVCVRWIRGGADGEEGGRRYRTCSHMHCLSPVYDGSFVCYMVGAWQVIDQLGEHYKQLCKMGLVTERLPMRGRAQSQGQVIEVMEWKVSANNQWTLHCHLNQQKREVV